MLQNIREKVQGWFAVAMLVLVGVPLALTFVSSDFSISSGGFAARVNGDEIPKDDFQRVYQNRLMAEQQAAGSLLPPEAEEALKRQTLDGMVLNRAITQYAHDSGFRVTPERVIESIRSMPIFQVGGEFSKPAYDAALAGQGISPLAFERDQQAQLAVGQLQQGLIESSFFTPAEFRRLISLDQERRDVAYILLDPEVLGADITVSDADVEAYYAANPGEFQSEETVNLEYVEVAMPDMAQDYAPDEAALQAAYDADPDRFQSAEQRRARHILIAVDGSRDDGAARALAGEVADKLATGEDFAALATQYSNDPGSASRGGDLGFAARGNYVEAFDEVLFELEPGETSAPVKTEFGYHIIRLEEVRPGTARSLEEVRVELTEEPHRRRAQDEFYAIAERVDDLALDNPTSLEPVARDTGLALQRHDGFSRRGGGPFGENPNLVGAVFSPGVLEGSENTPLIEIDDSRAIVARVAEHKLPALIPLDQVRPAIIDRLRTIQVTARATSLGEAIIERARAGESLAGIAAAEGLTVTDAGSVMRRAPAVPPDLLAAIFRAPKPTSSALVEGASLPNGGYAVFQVRSVTAGEPARIPQEQRDQRKQALAQRAAVSEVEALAAQLRETADVVVAPDLFETEDAEAL